jgi:integrase
LSKAKRRTRGQGSLKRRNGSRIFTAVYPDATGKRRERSTGATTKRDAERILAKWTEEESQVRAGLIDPSLIRKSRKAAIPLDKILDEYIQHSHRKGDSPQHVHQKRSHIEAWIAHCDGNDLADLTSETAVGFLEYKRASGVGNRTWNATRQDMAAFMNWCMKQGIVSSNPLDTVPKKDERQDVRRKRRAITEDELCRLLNVARTNGREAWYATAALSGLRKGELRGLDWSDIDFEKSVITLRQTKAGCPQTAVISKELSVILLAYRAARGEPDCGRVWPTTVTDRTRKRDFQRASIPLVDSQGRVVDLHALRKTLGTRLALKGVAPQVAQKIMRHSDYRVTMEHYVDLSVKDSLAAIESLSAVSSGDPAESAPSKALAPLTAHQSHINRRLQDVQGVVTCPTSSEESRSFAAAGIAQLVERQLPKQDALSKSDLNHSGFAALCESATPTAPLDGEVSDVIAALTAAPPPAKRMVLALLKSLLAGFEAVITPEDLRG